MAVDALQLGDQQPDALHPLGHLDAEQLLDRQAERHAVGLRAQVVHPLDERDDLLPLLLLRGLLDAGVQVADGRRRRQHGLAIELQHQPQHAVRAGVLRPHVDGHRFGAELRHASVSTNASSTSSQIACSSVRWTSWTRAVDGGRHVHVDLGGAPDLAAVAPGQRNRPQAEPPRRGERRHDVGRAAAGADPEHHVARLAERLDLPREHPVERVVVARCSSGRWCRSSARSRPAPRARAESGRRARPPRAARRPRCRRCRRPAACRRRGAPRQSPPPRARSAASRRGERARAARWSRPNTASQPLTVRARRSFAMFARNSSSVTCVGSVVRGFITICTG